MSLLSSRPSRLINAALQLAKMATASKAVAKGAGNVLSSEKESQSQYRMVWVDLEVSGSVGKRSFTIVVVSCISNWRFHL